MLLIICLYTDGFKFCYVRLVILFINVFSSTLILIIFCSLLNGFNYYYLTLTFLLRQRSGRPEFDPRSRHTKDFKNGT